MLSSGRGDGRNAYWRRLGGDALVPLGVHLRAPPLDDLCVPSGRLGARGAAKGRCLQSATGGGPVWHPSA